MFLPSDITLQFGDSGDFVAEMQRRLVTVSAGGKNLVTGHFDGMTVNAVSGFQARHGLRADGIAGPDTLRRLNTVYSGDTVSEDDTKKDEEENAKAAQAAHSQNLMLAQAAMLTPEPMFGVPVVEETLLAPEPSIAPITSAYSPAVPEAKPAPDAQEQLRAQTQREAAMQQPAPPPSSTDMLAQLLQNTSPVLAEPKPERPPLAERPPLTPPPLEANAPAINALPDTPAREANTPAASQQSLLQRGVQMANAALQKVADYFEAKLPDSALREAQQAGKILAKNGVTEVAIPTGPELPARGPDLPALAQTAAQTPQRG